MIHRSTPEDHAELRARMATESDEFERRVAAPLLTDEAIVDLPGVRLWHDDVRPAPEGWLHARTNHEAKAILVAFPVIEASLDHDLGYTGPLPGPCEACGGTGREYRFGEYPACPRCGRSLRGEPWGGGWQCPCGAPRLTNPPCPACDGDGFIGGDVFYDATEGDEDGEDLVRWMVETGRVPPKVTIHSWNPDGARRMALLLGLTGAEVTIRRYEVPR